MDASERKLLAETVLGVLSGGGSGTNPSADSDAALAALGWLEMLDTEPDDAVDIVFRALGAINATATALDDIVLTALGMRPQPDVAVVLPRFGSWEPPAHVDTGVTHVEGLATARAITANRFVVICGTGHGVHTVTVPAAAAEVRAVAGIDPDAGLHAVRASVASADPAPLDRTVWESAIAAGQRALAYEIAGANRTMLDLARTHATDRVQFGRPVAAFQAVRHRLAETLVAIEALDATLAAARDDPSPLTAALAKATAGRTSRTVAAHCQQVLAGIGFTTDHPFHRYLKRTMLLEGLLGSADEIALAVGRQLLSARRVPTLIDL